MKFNNDQNWLAKRAEQEDRHFISVGGLISRVSSLQEVGEPAGSGLEVTQLAFVRLLQLARRERRLSLEQLAEQADVDLMEVVKIEMGRASPLSPRTIYQLASLLRLPTKKLMVLAGLVQVGDVSLEEASLRFVVRSEPAKDLSTEEATALEEFVEFLGQD